MKSAGVLKLTSLSALGTMPLFLVASHVDLIRDDFTLTAGDIGLAATSFFGAASLASLPIGVLTDRLPERVTNAVAVSTSVVSSLSIVLLVGSAPALIASLALAGVANAALQAISNASAASGTLGGRVGLSFSVKQSAIPVAALIAGLFVPLSSAIEAWRTPFAVVALASIGCAFTRTPSPAPRTGPHRSVPVDPARPRLPRSSWLLIAACVTIASGAGAGVLSLLPAWGAEVGMEAGNVGLLIALASLLSVAGRIAAGHWADLIDSRHFLLIAGLIGITAGGLGLLSVPTTACLIAGALLVNIGWSWPGISLYAMHLLSQGRSGAATGSSQVGIFLGAALGPLMIGFSADHAGFSATWIFTAVVLAFTASAFCLLQYVVGVHTRAGGTALKRNFTP